MNFTPSAELLALQKKELEILDVVIDICEKYNITYYMMHGSLIGVIRHEGIIPWDDDIDIAVMRKDYKRFFEACRKELPEPYFVQFFNTDKTYNVPHIKIRDSSTCAITKGEYNYLINHKGRDCKVNYNMGIFLDVFPLDGIPEDKMLRKRYERKINICNFFIHLANISKTDIRTLKGHILLPFVRFFFFFVPEKLFILRLHSLMKKYSYTNTNLVGYTWWDMDKYCWKKDWFMDIKKADFSGRQVTIPVHYDEILHSEFGDYMTPVMASSDHGEMQFIDIGRSYMEYIKDIKANRGGVQV